MYPPGMPTPLAAFSLRLRAVPPGRLRGDEIVPSVFVPGVATEVAAAVADAARADGVTR